MSEIIWFPNEAQKVMLDRMACEGGDFSGSVFEDNDEPTDEAYEYFLSELKEKANGDPDELAKIQRFKDTFISWGWNPKTEGNDEQCPSQT